MVRDIEEVNALLREYMQLITLTLFIGEHGRAKVDETELVSSLSNDVAAVVARMALAAGQSMGTIEEFTGKRGIAVRDCFPVARSAVETFINATYVLAGGDTLAQRAIRHAQQKFYRDLDRHYGSAPWGLHVQAIGKPELDPASDLKRSPDEFTSSAGRDKNWTDDSMTKRIEIIGDRLGVDLAKTLIAAYALIYPAASEIIHGSLFGIELFYRGRGKAPETVDEFRALTEEHLGAIQSGLVMACDGYLRAYARVQGFDLIEQRSKTLLKNYFKVARGS